MTSDGDRVEPPLAGTERETLVGFLDFLRESLRLKTAGLGAEDLGRTAVGTLTLGGLLKHLAFVEDHWFSTVWLGRPPPEPWLSADWEVVDWDLISAAHDSPAELVALWDAAVARSRAVLAEVDDLGETVAPPTASNDPRPHFSMRWVLTHMVEEYARHLGHADLIRESIDGAVGE